MRRVSIVAGIGVIAAAAALPVVGWEHAILTGWNVAALVFLVACWQVILRADADQTEHLALREDPTRPTATALVVGASVVSLLAVGITLAAAGDLHGWPRTGSIIASVLTVVLSWVVVNTVFTLHYADLDYHARHPDEGVDFGSADPADWPDYRDFAYLAFTIGMCYQVSDTTLRDRSLRRTVLVHAMVSYVFGVVIIAASINLVAGLAS